MTNHQNFDTFQIPNSPQPVEPLQAAPIPEAASPEADPTDEARQIAEISQIERALESERELKLGRAA